MDGVALQHLAEVIGLDPVLAMLLWRIWRKLDEHDARTRGLAETVAQNGAAAAGIGSAVAELSERTARLEAHAMGQGGASA